MCRLADRQYTIQAINQQAYAFTTMPDRELHDSLAILSAQGLTLTAGARDDPGRNTDICDTFRYHEQTTKTNITSSSQSQVRKRTTRILTRAHIPISEMARWRGVTRLKCKCVEISLCMFTVCLYRSRSYSFGADSCGQRNLRVIIKQGIHQSHLKNT